MSYSEVNNLFWFHINEDFRKIYYSILNHIEINWGYKYMGHSTGFLKIKQEIGDLDGFFWETLYYSKF